MPTEHAGMVVSNRVQQVSFGGEPCWQALETLWYQEGKVTAARLAVRSVFISDMLAAL